MEILEPSQADKFDAMTVDFRAEKMHTVVGRDMVQTTTINSDYGVLILGTLRGDIFSSDGTVFVEQGGTVCGTVTAKQALIAGRVQGNLRVPGTLYLTDTAHVEGDIEYGELALMSDATIDGTLKKIR